MKINIKRFFHAIREKTPQRYRTSGDQARNNKDWAQAIIEYKKHLELCPQDQAIWVQIGHALKEQGDYDAAIQAYYQAIELLPSDYDVHLHLAYLLERTGKQDQALNIITTAVKLTPSKDAYDLAHRLGYSPEMSTLSKTSKVDKNIKYLIEIDDLFDYLKSYKTPSGIQRVQIGIIRYIIESNKKHHGQYACIRTGKFNTGFWQIPFDKILNVLDYITLPDVSQHKLLSLIEEAERDSKWFEPKKGQIYLILGAFWGFGANASRYIHLKKSGVAVGVYIYDIIPISYPEYCSSGLVNEFTLALGDGLYSFDFIFTISEFVAKDVKRLQVEYNLREVPVSPILLAHQLHAHKAEITKFPEWGEKIEFLKNRNFVLMVSTIEARKNHIYLYMAWKALINEGIDPPDLVFVGRFGWRMDDFKSVLEDTDFLGKRIHILHDLLDVDLEVLYQECQFTIFPSIVEGWGLPVGESLAHGRPCIASETSSIPEVGGKLVDYIDPLNLHTGIKCLKKMILNKSYRDKRTNEIRKQFVPRTWDDVGKEIMEQLGSLSNFAPASYAPPLLEVGELFEPAKFAGSEKISASYIARPLRPLLAECWYASEKDFGVWMRGKSGNIHFSSPLHPNTDIIVYLEIVTPPWTDHRLSLSVGHNYQKVTQKENLEVIHLMANERHILKIKGKVEDDGSIFVGFHIEGDTIKLHPNKNPNDPREFYIGLKRLIYTAVTDIEERIKILESFATNDFDKVEL
ncbi:glycosyltransferase family 4 protein [Zymomonas mobilis]|uniref:Glycosyl transferase group 1 n=1 Tax=Zymomonas mobilis subsp. pomaceae (strain ATCC 29192 / DSM 22645 / JCM 10191 / CCUG 17912 / NBRC 13757 / NCIMB 11200 / NRRL B-4491 / Barker I) TaxID=579138 RepID=F8ERW5_ZYMMT|nr:glycosyltransferase family 1 protein [Zymomonas mobilis]AEI38578.1 glycosyl transferase group 1 [Zymomonas mobilis subsp. pomaceae ATCC 29192]MDX5948268.1 glycosyltransferase [Zymomonas mobilis subsp. pomaceae]GEB89023.1 hypothetical protein ZMO02_06600 [Zymomonas mobilis subsp. pomaceae]